MNTPKVFALAEDRSRRRVLEAILADRVADGSVAIREGETRSATIALAQKNLLDRPDRPIALVLEVVENSPDSAPEQRARLYRLMQWAAFDNWHVALAVPSLRAWVLADPWLRARIGAAEEGLSDHAFAEKVVATLGDRPFDVDALRAASDEFRRLEAFIVRCLRPEPASAGAGRP